METEATIQSQSDAQTVEAIRRGDVDRYRELVERHERLVYAVAWSRLGDMNLAEEVAQETFIRGYQRLALLGHGGKFGGWIASIARNLAINLGLRHRRELNKRDRWALEVDLEADVPLDDVAETTTAETLQQTMATLPSAHRECLVLFYLENKSNAEAAAVLNISEATFRVRLHRARTALRQELEQKLGTSLQKLRPSKTLVATVMAGVLASSSAKAAAAGGTVGAAGVGAKATSSIAKTFLFSWFPALIALIGVLPGMLFAWLVSRKEKANFREADGFRARLYATFIRSFLWGFPVLFLGSFGVGYLIIRSWGQSGINIFLVLVGIGLTAKSARSLVIQRNFFQKAQFIYVLILSCGFFATALGWLPPRLAQVPMVLATIVFALTMKHRPARMDFSLFLRSTRGILHTSPANADATVMKRLDPPALLEFARFLGSRYLVGNFRWEPRGLRLQLPAVKTHFLRAMAMILPFPFDSSFIWLNWDGTVDARCGLHDAEALRALPQAQETEMDDLEPTVAATVENAWDHFLNNDLSQAEQALGERSENELFVVPVNRSPWTRWGQILLLVSVTVMIAAIVLRYQIWRFTGPQPVSATEDQVHLSLAAMAANESAPERLDFHVVGFLVCPPTNLFGADGLQTMHAEILKASGVDLKEPPKQKLDAVARAWLLQNAITQHIISWEEIGVTPEQAAHALRTQPKHLRFNLISHESTVDGKKYVVRGIGELTLANLRWVKEIGCLDLVDRETVVSQIFQRQVLSGETAPDQPPIPHWRAIRGLFEIPNWPVFQETYLHLAALEILGGLDRIDREACIDTILKLHRGQGRFEAPELENRWRLKINGDARNTFWAFESLRILGALNRVKDLDQWQFRAEHVSRSGETKGLLTWEELEAWTCQQRLQRFLQHQKLHPGEPAPSLLDL